MYVSCQKLSPVSQTTLSTIQSEQLRNFEATLFADIGLSKCKRILGKIDWLVHLLSSTCLHTKLLRNSKLPYLPSLNSTYSLFFSFRVTLYVQNVTLERKDRNQPPAPPRLNDTCIWHYIHTLHQGTINKLRSKKTGGWNM